MTQHQSLQARIRHQVATAITCVTMIMLVVSPPRSAQAEKLRPAAAGPERPASEPVLGRGAAGLPTPVGEMRDAIIAAARSGRLDELLVPIQWNELPPDFGDLPVAATLAHWRKTSPDGSGRKWLALLIDLLESPYVAVRRGPDIENSRIYIWPAFAELPIATLTPPLQVDLLRLVTAEEAERMKQAGGYDGLGIAIGADGTWHAFKRVIPLAKRPQQSRPTK